MNSQLQKIRIAFNICLKFTDGVTVNFYQEAQRFFMMIVTLMSHPMICIKLPAVLVWGKLPILENAVGGE
jgi:hypothetical protein